MDKLVLPWSLESPCIDSETDTEDEDVIYKHDFGYPIEKCAPLRKDQSIIIKSLGYAMPRTNDSNWVTLLNCAACGYLIVDEYVLCIKEGHLTCQECVEKIPERVCEFRWLESDAKNVGNDPKSDLRGQSEIHARKEPQDAGELRRNQKSVKKGLSPDGLTDKRKFQSKKAATSRTQTNQLTSNVKKAGHPIKQTNGDQSDDCRGATKSVVGLPEDEHPPKQYMTCGAALVSQPHGFIEALLRTILLDCPFAFNGCTAKLPAKIMKAHYNEKCRHRTLEFSADAALDQPFQ